MAAAVSLAEAAVLLAQRGYSVFPVREDKSPRTPRGHLDATSDREVIESWEWDGGIGLVIPDRWFVVDVDPRNGGDKTIEALVGGLHKMPHTRTVHTRSGGWHFYFRLADDRDLRGKLGPGVDIKKPGRGYVLVPPTPGYAYARGGRPAPAPQWLLDELTLERKATAAGEYSKPKFFAVAGGTPYGLAALRQKLEQVREHEEGGRRANLNACAFVLATLVAGGELDEDKTCEALLAAAVHSGLSEDQAVRGMRSGWEAGLLNPRQAEAG